MSHAVTDDQQPTAVPGPAADPGGADRPFPDRMRAVAVAAEKVIGAHSPESLREILGAICRTVLPFEECRFAGLDASGPTAAAGDAALADAAPADASMLRASIVAGGRPLAEILLVNPASRPYGAEDREVLESLACLAGAALMNIQLLSERRSAEEALEVERAYFEQLFENSPEAVVVLDNEDRILRINREFTRLFGYSSEESEGRTINELIVPTDLHQEGIALTNQVAGGRQIQWETVRRAKDGTIIPVSILATPIRAGGDQIAVYGIYRDISAQKEAEEALKRLSTTDELTGLYNRRGFFMLAEQQRKLARRRGRDLLLLFIDLDNFKEINDGFGHREGDQVLAEMGQLLKSMYRDSDIIARLDEDSGVLARVGGDEFVVLAVDASTQSEEILKTRLQDRIAEYNAASGRPYTISVSVGAVRTAADDTHSIDEILTEADRRMYEEKRNARR